MKRILLLEICFLFLATTFQSDNFTGWVQQTIPRQDLIVRDLKFLDSLTGYMVSSRRNPDTSFIFKTIDGGNNWTTTVFENLYLTCLDFVDSSIGYSGGGQITNGTVKKTTNGGQNWFTVSLVGNSIFLEDIFFVNKDTGWVSSTFVIGGGLWRTINGGLSWQKQLGSDFSKIFFINSNTGWVIGNSQSLLYKTTNCGTNWFSQAGFLGVFDVFFTNPDTGWVIGYNNVSDSDVVKTTNGGYNWFPVNNPVIVPESRLFFVDNNRGWAGSGGHKIFITKDGFNWGKQYSPQPAVYNISFIDSSVGWAGYGGLVHTVDGGGIITGINHQNEQVVNDYILYQNYPNPFNSKSNIKYKISKTSNIKIKMFDVSGKELKTLIDNQQNQGDYEITFEGGNLSSGIYFYTLFADDKRVDTRKMVCLK